MTERESQKWDLRPAATLEGAVSSFLRRWSPASSVGLRPPPWPPQRDPWPTNSTSQWSEWENRGQTPGRSLRCSCNLTAHSTFCLRGRMLGPAVPDSFTCPRSNARFSATSAIEGKSSSSKPPPLNIGCLNLPVFLRARWHLLVGYMLASASSESAQALPDRTLTIVNMNYASWGKVCIGLRSVLFNSKHCFFIYST